jgi:hypothetical protein
MLLLLFTKRCIIANAKWTADILGTLIHGYYGCQERRYNAHKNERIDTWDCCIKIQGGKANEKIIIYSDGYHLTNQPDSGCLR